MKCACICRYCGKAFVAYSEKSCCKNCSHLEENEFKKITDYLESHPSSNAVDLSKALDMTVRDILRYVDEGRLSVKRGDIKDY